MRPTLTLSFFLSIASIPAFAGESVEVRWQDFCRIAGDRQLEIVVSSGETITGYCAAISVDEVSLTTPSGIVKLTRAALSHVRMERSKGGQLASLGHGMRDGLKEGAHWLLSPSAPLGMVAIPGTLAWGAIAAPFCLIGDLRHHLLGNQEVSLK